MKKNKKRILLLPICILITSCNATNSNDLIIKNFTVKDSKECAKAYLDFYERTNDFTDYGVDIYYFLGKYHDTANVCIMFSYYNAEMYEASGEYVSNYKLGSYIID